MASFSAELQVTGRRYPVRFCTYEFTQATGERGRVSAKVRHGLVHLTLDVPDDDVLLGWAAAPHKPLAGQVVFADSKGGPARETLAWAAGECVGYREEFASGDADAGAYVCHLTIAATQLTMRPGGPAAYVGPAARDHGRPQPALIDPFVVPLLTPAPVAEAVAEAAAASVLAPVALILALILGSTTPAQAPGLPPVNRDEARLRYLVAQHAAGTLAPEEEAELIALLAKVKGIRIQRLSDLGRFAAPPQKIPNKFPNEAMPADGKIIPYEIVDGNIKGVNGRKQFDFVIDDSGKLIIGNKHHLLGSGQPVQAAGQLRLNGQGQIRQIDNLSGHYQPSLQKLLITPDF